MLLENRCNRTVSGLEAAAPTNGSLKSFVFAKGAHSFKWLIITADASYNTSSKFPPVLHRGLKSTAYTGSFLPVITEIKTPGNVASTRKDGQGR